MKFKKIIAAVMALALTAGTFSVNSAFNTTASAAQATHPIVCNRSEGPGTVNAPSQAAAGTQVAITVTASNGCEIDNFTVVARKSNKELIYDHPRSQSKTYIINMPDEEVSYNVEFSSPTNKPFYIYQKLKNFGGDISIDDKGALKQGETITITATPKEGYKVDNILVQYHNSQLWVSGQPRYCKTDTIQGQPNQTVYTFSMPANDIDIRVNFAIDSTPAPAPEPEPTPTPTPTPDPTPTLSWKKGDANCDGIVTAADATAVLKHLTGIMELSYVGSINADMDQNGKVTAADATAILKFLINQQ